MNCQFLAPIPAFSDSQSPNTTDFVVKRQKRTYQRPQSSYQVSIKQQIKQRTKEKKNNQIYKSQISHHKQTYSIHHRSSFTPKQYPQENPSTHKLSINDFEIGDLLGRGAESRVRIAIHKQTGFIVSIKSILRQKVQKKFDVFVRGLKIQCFLDHPNIAQIYGIIVEQKHVHIIVEYCVDNHLTNGHTQFTKQNNTTKYLLYHISKAILHLHENKIQHRDLKLENILLTFDVPKITDFQLSVYTKLAFLQRKTLCGSPAYFSPQMIINHRYNKKADIWSLGIIFYEVLCGQFPFEIHNYEDVRNIQSKNIKEFPDYCTEEAIDLITSMLNKDSHERVSIEEVIKHKFFQMVEEQ